MKMPDIRLHQPATIAEACDLLERHGGRVRILAGGTDLLVDLKQGRVTGVEHLVSLNNIEGLSLIEDMKDKIRIGALVTPNQASQDPSIRRFFPALLDAITSMGAYPIRNMATIAGNIAGAVPSSDLIPVFIAASGEVLLATADSQRSVMVASYFLGPRETVCGECEILTHLLLPKPQPRTGMSYQKFMLRGANALAVAGVAAMLRLDGDGDSTIADSRIVLTAVAPRPVIAEAASGHLQGKHPSEALFAETARITRGSAEPITDIRGTAEYRSELVEILTKRALLAALSRAQAKGD